MFAPIVCNLLGQSQDTKICLSLEDYAVPARVPEVGRKKNTNSYKFLIAHWGNLVWGRWFTKELNCLNLSNIFLLVVEANHFDNQPGYVAIPFMGDYINTNKRFLQIPLHNEILNYYILNDIKPAECGGLTHLQNGHLVVEGFGSTTHVVGIPAFCRLQKGWVCSFCSGRERPN